MEQTTLGQVFQSCCGISLLGLKAVCTWSQTTGSACPKDWDQMTSQGPFQPQPACVSAKWAMLWCILDGWPLSATAASGVDTVEMSQVTPQSCPCINAIGRTQRAEVTFVRGWKLRGNWEHWLRDGEVAGFSSSCSPSANLHSQMCMQSVAYRQEPMCIPHNWIQEPFETAEVSLVFTDHLMEWESWTRNQ